METNNVVPLRGRTTRRRTHHGRACNGAQRRAMRSWMRELTVGELSYRAQRYGNPIVIHGSRA